MIMIFQIYQFISKIWWWIWDEIEICNYIDLELRVAQKMSFFSEQGDDSNLQYDDTAFLYFIASMLIVGAVTTLGFIIYNLLTIRIDGKKRLAKSQIFSKKIQNLRSQKIRRVFNLSLLGKIALVILLILLTLYTYGLAARAENKLKGFDPYQILGVTREATLKQIKKAYRKLALEYHPDKNVGNSAAQSKFILISKSYECFTNEQKKDSCFKYGNPDGNSAFRIGIGLPNFFIKAEYNYIVLPIVLSIFLIIIPLFMLSWGNRISSLDPNGVSVQSYDTLFQCVSTEELTIINGIYMLSSFKQLYADGNLGPISPQQKDALQQQLTKNIKNKWDILDKFSDNQLKVFWEIYRYMCGMADFSNADFREKVEYMMSKMHLCLLPFTQKSLHNVVFFGNPKWKVVYLGSKGLELLIAFERCYLNRSFLKQSIDATNWQYNMDLTPEELKIAAQHPIDNFYQVLKDDKIGQYLKYYPQNRRETLLKQFKNIPVYTIESKIKVANKDVKKITDLDHAEIVYKISKKFPTCGFCLLKNYPYPKVQKIYLIVKLNGELYHFSDIEFDETRDYFIGKISFAQPKVGPYNFQLAIHSDCYFGLDTGTNLEFSVIGAPEQLKNKKIQIHKEDLNLQKFNCSFFEEAMNIQVDPEEGILSDSEEDSQ